MKKNISGEPEELILLLVTTQAEGVCERRKRWFSLTAAGARALRQILQPHEQFWQAIPEPKGSGQVSNALFLS